MAIWQHLRSSTVHKRPTTSLADGRLAINTNGTSPGLFFKDSAGTGIVKVGPVHVGTTAPNSSPAVGGSSGNYTGEQWLDTSVAPAQLKVWNGSAWVGIVADELPVSKLQDGTAGQIVQTDSAGTGVEWSNTTNLPLGSAASPAYSFQGDSNTGLYSPGPDQLAISTGGVGRLFVTSDGRVGIGTGAPSVVLDTYVVSGQNEFRQNVGPATRGQFISTDTDQYIVCLGSGGQTFWNGGSERMRITSDGKVGIGTSSPQASLEVIGATRIGAANIATVFPSSSAAGGSQFSWNRSSGSAETNICNLYDNASLSFEFSQKTGASTANVLYEMGSLTHNWRINDTERARIDANGRLLVGTSSGVATIAGYVPLLQVQSATAAQAAGSITATSNDAYSGGLVFGKQRAGAIVQNGDGLGQLRFTGYDGSTYQQSGSIGCEVDGTPGANDMPGRLVFATTADGASSPTERLRITSDGKVGIGTNSPSYLLDVAGITRIGAPTGDAQLEIGLGATGNRNAFIDLVGDTTYTDYGLRLIRDNSGPNAFSALRHRGTGSLTLLTEEVAPITFQVNLSERARIDSSGRLLVGTSSSVNSLSGIDPTLQVSEGSGVAAALLRSTNDTAGANLVFRKTRGTTPAAFTVVSSGDTLGRLVWVGTDGAAPVEGARIEAAVDNTPGANDMPCRLVFSTTADGASSPTERMRINKDGVTLIGTQSVNGTAGLTFSPDLTEGSAQIVFNRTSTTNTSFCTLFKNGGTDVGSISYTNTATAYNTSSDYRLKENVVPLTGAIDRVKDLQIYRFNFIADPAKTVDGFIAHEVQDVVPEAIAGEKDAVDGNGNPVYQGIDQSKLVPLLTAALQEAIGEIESLKARVAALESA